MADRFWRGGTAAWDGTAGSKWAATAGGATGAAVPTSADDVFFDATSSGTCTISAGNTGAKSINCTGFTGTIAGSAAITVSGSITLVAGMTYTYSGLVTLVSTGTLTTAGKNLEALTVDGIAITITLGDALTCNGTLTLSRGTIDTANYNLTFFRLTSGSGSARALSLGSSTVTGTGFGNVINFSIPDGLTFTAGTSQVVMSGSGDFLGGNQTFYNVSFTNTSAGTRNITGANTFNNLAVTGPSSAGVVQLTFAAAQTINGTLSTTGTAGNRRVWFLSSTYGGGQTLTVAAASLTDADFRDIYVIGAGAPISGTRIGNRGNNRGITFSTPKSVYWNLAGAQNWSANGWAPGSAGTPNTDNFPLPQDTAVFDNAGSVTGTITLNSALAFVGSVDMSARTNAMTLSFGAATTVYGSWTNGSGTTLSGGNGLTFSGEGTKTITSAGKTFSCPITVDAYNGAVELADALNIDVQNFRVDNGTFDTKNYNTTASIVQSNSTTFRTITFGSSTITLSGTIPVNFASTNLIFNAGTSQITCTRTSAATFNGSGQTFYNVSFTGTTAVTHVVNDANTFNNFTLTAPASAGVMGCTFSANQTITGTLTCAGASAVRRIFVRSNIPGTTRTLTVGTLSATDCDFRDITIAGTAAGSSPTRAGDCGGNSGITFPAPKTVYWNLSGVQNWSATAWAPGTGGVPDINNFPLAQDTAVFDNTGSVGSVTINAAWNIGTFDASSRTSAMTLNPAASPTFYGNFLYGTGVTVASSANIFTFSGRGTQTITNNGVTTTNNVTIDCATGTVQLADALVLDSVRTLTLTSGTFDAVTYNVTTGRVSLSAGTLKMGTGTWTLSGTGTVWSNSAGVFYKGTANITLSDTSGTARTFAGGSQSYNKLTIGGATGTSTLTITDNNQFTELASTKTVAHTIALGTTTQTFGKWSVTGTSGNVVTLTGTGTSHILAGDATSGIDYLAMGSIGFAATSPGEFYAGANSTGTAGAPVFRTAPPAARTLYWVGGTGNWNDTARWSTSSGGAGGAATPTSLDNVIFDSASNATGYTATVNQITGGNRCKALTIAGPATGNLTLAGSVALLIHDDITLPATGLTRTYTGAITLTSSQTGRTLTTNGVALASAITVNGVSCEWTLADALNNGSSAITVTNGLLDTDTYNLTADSLSSDNSNSRTIDFGSSTVALSGATPLTFGTTETNRANLTFTAGTSQINISNVNSTLNGNNQTFYNVSFTGTDIGTRAITGANTFNNLTFTVSAGAGNTGLTQLSFNSNVTVNGTFTCSGSSAIARGFVRSNTFGTVRTITAAALSSTDCDFRDITIAGVAAGTSLTRAGDCGGNSGITFPAAKTVYRVGTDTSWAGSSSWALSSGGAGSNDNFPLAQDTAVIDNSTTLTGTLSVTTVFNFSALDASTRTTGITLNHNDSVFRYGSYILGSGVTVSGTSTQTFAGRGTMTFTSAGKTITFSITVNAPSGTFQLGDATTTSSTITHTQGTFNASNYNLTSTTFASSNSNVRTITMGSGTWTLSSTGTVWDTSTSTNLTLNANTSTILLSNTSTTARTFTGGGMSFNKLTIGGATGTSVLSITGFNSFNEIASTKTVAHTVRFTANQNTIGTWSVTGSSGNVVTVDSSSAGTRRLMRLTNATSAIDYLSVRDIEIDAIDKFYAGANSTNVGNTLNVYFAAAPTPPPVVSGGNMFLLFM